MATILGIDPSLRSTGICIKKDDLTEYHLITTHITKKLENNCPDWLHIHLYEPIKGTRDWTSVEKEYIKTADVRSIIVIFEDILKSYYSIDYAVIEAIAMAASGRIDELAMINGAMRMACMNAGIPIYAVPPTTNKMVFSGNGQADKDTMIACWKALEKKSQYLQGKIDDLADAYSLACFPVNDYITHLD